MQKYSKNFLILLLFLLANFWFWRIYSQNISILITLILSVLALQISLQKPKFYIIFGVVFIVLLIFQFTTTNKTSYLLSPLEKDQMISRTNEYPNKTHFVSKLIENNNFIIFTKLEKNFFGIFDTNSYFFAGHPREGSFSQHFDQFPFIYLPFLLIGLFTTKWFANKLVILSLVLPVILITIIGADNTLGLFSLIPFFVTVTKVGFDEIL